MYCQLSHPIRCLRSQSFCSLFFSHFLLADHTDCSLSLTEKQDYVSSLLKVKPFICVCAQNELDRFYGEYTKGIQETENMLITGTSILGVGKVCLQQGQMKIGPPDDSDKFYIITRLRLGELVDFYKNQSGTYRVVAFISGFVGSTLLLYAIYHFVANLVERRRRRLQFSEIRRALSQQRRPTRNVDDIDTGEEEEGEENSELRQEDICVVCLTNPRQVIALPCGHFAICADCAELIPYPKRCPMCRASVEKFYPVYRS